MARTVDALHKNLPLGSNHILHNGEYANAAARIAEAAFTDNNVDKIYKQLDDLSLWRCLSQTAGVPTWEPLGGTAIDPGTRTIISPNPVSSDFTILAAWVNKAANSFPLIRLNPAGPCTATFQLASSEAVFPGEEIQFYMRSSELVTFQGVLGTSIIGLNGLKTNGHWSRISALYEYADTWILTGDLVP